MTPPRCLLVTSLLGLLLAAPACVTYRPHGAGSPGHAYVLETRNYVVYVASRVWSCDATTGTPQCWPTARED